MNKFTFGVVIVVIILLAVYAVGVYFLATSSLDMSVKVVIGLVTLIVTFIVAVGSSAWLKKKLMDAGLSPMEGISDTESIPLRIENPENEGIFPDGKSSRSVPPKDIFAVEGPKSNAAK